MLLLRTASPWMLLSILALLSVRTGARSRSGAAAVTRSPREAHGAFRGRFTLKDDMRCTWAAEEAGGGGVRMSVKCEDAATRGGGGGGGGGVTDVRCEYNARPQSCPGYRDDPRAYYKQVSRALKKMQTGLCQRRRALVKVRMCKRAPEHAHFRLDPKTVEVVTRPQSSITTISTTISTTTTSTPAAPRVTGTPAAPRVTGTPAAAPRVTGTPAHCRGRADHSEAAAEYCSRAWASVCAFLLSILQSEDC